MPTIATKKPKKNGMRQRQAVKSAGNIRDFTNITEPNPSSNPIGMAKPTHALQNARRFERAACSITQVERFRIQRRN